MSIDVPHVSVPARGARIVVNVDDTDAEAFEGQTIAAVLLGSGRLAFRETRRGKAPRGMFCGMGICFDCLVTVEGQHNIRACVTPVRQGLRIQTQGGQFWGGSQ